ncbi:hypothetical protein Golob_008748 [Gossypium lobatum]|uniref:Uncharacterized protein n=1 Tax=Gossypium lobatum TaxID=34289 RepID=A0A7J8MGC4_9ROSI|nr:hypothetical protein [Gossypium lobatum]
MNRVTHQWYHRICSLQTTHWMKRRALTSCLFLLHWMKKTNQWIPTTQMMGNQFLIQQPTKTDTHEVVKPTAVHSKSPINVDELVGMSKLSLGESIGDNGPSSLSLKLDGSSRQSAFHANPSSRNSSGSPIHAV